MSAPFSFRGPTVGLGDDEEPAEPTDDEEPDLPPSPEEIQIDAADVGQFDQTYLARSQNFKLEGRFSPAPFPLQVIPRVAYTINYNFIYNEDRDRWEPDTGNGNGAGVTGVASGTIVMNSGNGDAVELGVGGPNLDGDGLVASVAFGSDPGTNIEFEESPSQAVSNGVSYTLEWSPGNGDYLIEMFNHEGVQVEVDYVVARIEAP